MVRRTLVSLSLLAGSLSLFAACSDSPVAPSAVPTVTETSAIAVAAVPDLTDFRLLSGQLWVCTTGNLPGSDFHYKYTITNKANGLVVAKGTVHGMNIGDCTLVASVPTNVRGHYKAVVKQDAPGIFYLGHGFFDFGVGYPGTTPLSIIDLPGRTLTSGLSSDGGVVMTFYNLANQGT